MSTGEPLLFLTEEGVDINVTNGNLDTAQAIETFCLLALFGGNTESQQWWGNVIEQDSARKYASETQVLLESLPPGSNNLQKLKRAVENDLSGLGAINATLDSVDISIPAAGRVQIAIAVTITDRQYSVDFDQEWSK